MKNKRPWTGECPDLSARRGRPTTDNRLFSSCQRHFLLYEPILCCLSASTRSSYHAIEWSFPRQLWPISSPLAFDCQDVALFDSPTFALLQAYGSENAAKSWGRVLAIGMMAGPPSLQFSRIEWEGPTARAEETKPIGTGVSSIKPCLPHAAHDGEMRMS